MMNTTMSWFAIAALSSSLVLGCGGKDKEAKSAGDAQGEKAEKGEKKSATEQIEELKAGLEADLDAVMAPLRDVEAAFTQLEDFPARHEMSLDAVMGMLKGSVSAGEVKLTADFSGTAEAKAELEQIIGKIVGAVQSLQEVPKRAGALLSSATEATAKLPTLVTAATTSLQAQLSNPMLKADKKLEVEAELAKVATLQADTEALITGIQAEVTEIPARATSLLVKIGASAGGGGATADAPAAKATATE